MIIIALCSQNSIAQNCLNQGCFAYAGPDQTYCTCAAAPVLGAYPAESPSSCNGSSNFTYSWVPAPGLNYTTIQHPIATPTVTTTYTLYVTFPAYCECDGSNCTTPVMRSDDVKVTYVGGVCCKIENPMLDPKVNNISLNIPSDCLLFPDLDLLNIPNTCLSNAVQFFSTDAADKTKEIIIS